MEQQVIVREGQPVVFIGGLLMTYVSGFFYGAGFITAAILIHHFFGHGLMG